MKARATHVSVFVAILLPLTASADAVTDWNSTTIALLTASGQPPTVQTRALAMVHVAMHDAINSVEGRYRHYAVRLPPFRHASPEAAASAAAHDVLLALYAAHQEKLDAAYQASLSQVHDRFARESGVRIGQHVARHILDLRSNDGSTASDNYVPGSEPGQWRPTPPAFALPVTPQWKSVTPFTLESPSQFRAPGPPSLYSLQYARDLLEVYAGAAKGSTRTKDQTEIAQFLYEMSQYTWNRIARVVASQHNLDLWQNARLFALMGLGAADSFIGAWDSKYEYNFWRPITAIRFATDPEWDAFLVTPAHPDYVSGHSTYNGVMSVILLHFFQSDEAEFTFTTSTAPGGAYRSFTSFSGAAEEGASSRVYAGIHFRSACNDGLALGRQIGNWVVDHFLQPLGGGTN